MGKQLFHISYIELDRLIKQLYELETEVNSVKQFAKSGNNKGETYASVVTGCDLVEQSRCALCSLIGQTRLLLEKIEKDVKNSDQQRASKMK